MTPAAIAAAYRGEYECPSDPAVCTFAAPLIWGPLTNSGLGILINLLPAAVTPHNGLNLQVLVQDSKGNFYALWDAGNSLGAFPISIMLYPGVTYGSSAADGTLIKSASLTVPAQFWIQVNPLNAVGNTASITTLKYTSLR